MTPEQLSELVVKVLDDAQGIDIRVMDVRGMTSIADFMIVASGRSNRQVKAISDRVVAAAKDAGVKVLGVEGLSQCEWVLIDLGDVIVHAMQPATRDFYQIEKLWVPVAGELKYAS